MLELAPKTTFRKHLKLMKKRGKDLQKLTTILETLQQRKPLQEKHRDHWLKGNYVGYRECHIEPDWLLVYRAKGHTLELLDTGSHADLFT